jgi:large subunit ribosomal protein L18
MVKKESRNVARVARHKRIRKNLHGTSSTPRLCVFKSNKDLYVQIIDDEEGKTLVSVSGKELKLNGVNIENAKKVGEEIAARAKKAKIKTVVFDRGGYLYHGVVKALAESAREKGLEF